MKFSFQEKRLTSLLFQRNTLAGLSGILLLTNCLLTIFLFFKTEKTIFMPAESKQSYWIEGNRFSPTYLEEQALYFSHLLLDVTEKNILHQGDILLRYVDSQTYGLFKSKLYEDENRLKKDNLSLHFAPLECEVFPEKLKVNITGDLIGYVASKQVTSYREKYELSFSSIKGRLFLKSFNVISSDREKK